MPPVCGVPQAVNDIHTIIQQTDFPERAEAIADQIMAQEPHVIGLQEVSLLRTQFPGNALAPDGSGILFLGDFPIDPRFTFKTDAEHVEYDYLQILLDALAARGLHYVAVEGATATNADVEFPAIEFDDACNPIGFPTDVRLTDRDVMLVRAGLEVNMSMADNFMAYFPDFIIKFGMNNIFHFTVDFINDNISKAFGHCPVGNVRVFKYHVKVLVTKLDQFRQVTVLGFCNQLIN